MNLENSFLLPDIVRKNDGIKIQRADRKSGNTDDKHEEDKEKGKENC